MKQWLHIFGLFLVMGFTPANAGQAVNYKLENLTISRDEAQKHSFTVEVANTRESRAQGLMFRKQLAPDAGMLFIYPQERAVSMWMKNTFIPLDMLFISSEGRITHIAPNAEPHSLTSITSKGPAIAVLELPGGTAERLDIRPGDRIKSPSLNGGKEQ